SNQLVIYKVVFDIQDLALYYPPMKNMLLCFIVVLMFSSCKKESTTTDAVYIENTYFGDCFLMIPEVHDEIVICSEKEYLDYMDQKRVTGLGSDCEDAIPTDIDFKTHSLIGTFTSGGCSAKYDRSIHQDGNEITYNISVEYSGFCAMLVYSMNWALIPKLKNKEEVIFEVEEVSLN
ncbi:MAG: hypothetical protein ACPGTP_02090, partial [Bacteroidia bacterium]